MGDATANALLQGLSQGTMRVVVFRKDLEKAKQIMDITVINSFDDDQECDTE
jgi:hypothetical protein